ncbi:hypothetical protein NG20_00945 [Bacillus subtilis]|nr:hypothetical protein Q433_11430 [Bacillus subtilis subsp. subtilis str. OH 131.1]AOL27208.1 hypothetical protein BGM23_11680 [Bacillus sp. FJAT-14266]AOL29866.1 hypothetical protein BGM20_04170 [Alkalicoccobacillus gibsonii]AWM21160.1 hypothetical protein DJ572_10245 [Bacillus subtilis]AYK63389.1 hypothetical protein D9C14_19520 [Bacillus subtilis subsp. subtilis]
MNDIPVKMVGHCTSAEFLILIILYFQYDKVVPLRSRSCHAQLQEPNITIKNRLKSIRFHKWHLLHPTAYYLPKKIQHQLVSLIKEPAINVMMPNVSVMWNQSFNPRAPESHIKRKTGPLSFISI